MRHTKSTYKIIYSFMEIIVDCALFSLYMFHLKAGNAIAFIQINNNNCELLFAFIL